jgi:hypothetical protein
MVLISMAEASLDGGPAALGADRTPPQDIIPPRRTRFVDFVNAGMNWACEAGFWQVPSLDIEELMEEAQAATGLSDFGDPWFLEPLSRLVDSLESEAQLNTGGRWVANGTIRKVLHDRLWAQQWFETYPEIQARPLKRPVIVVGPMRSGTTRLHRLLAADHRFNHLRSFETISPVPAPDFVRGGRDPRLDLARRILRVARLANPRTLSIHPTGPLEPEEELGLLVRSFWGLKQEAQWWVPSYGRWCEAQDATPAYEYMAKLLKLVGWSQQASSLRPWILKTPQHMLDLPALLAVFPDARLIFTHRDPRSVVGSAASLAWNQSVIYSDHVEPEAVGAEWLRKTKVQVDRMRAARDAIPASRRIDVHYEEMDSDWRSAMARIYDFLDLDIQPVLPAMEAYQDRCRAAGHAPHRYSLGEFGLTPEKVLDELGGYVADYGITMEGRRQAV